MTPEQSASFYCPATGSELILGAGGVDGVTLTSDVQVFAQSGTETILEAKADMSLVTDAGLGCVGATGVLIGTPATIQHSAGSGIQIYAGAAVSVSTGASGSPGDPFKASEAPKVDAGNTAESACNWQDGIKGAGDMLAAGIDGRDAWKDGKKYDAAKQAFSGAKGGWDVLKAGGVESAGADKAFGAAGLGLGGVDALKAAESGDMLGLGTTAVSTLWGAGGMSAAAAQKVKQDKIKASFDAAAGEAKAAKEANKSAGAPGGTLGMPADGPRIHEVAPANIDRECGANLTAKVGGNKTSSVDGKIEYKAGSAIEMKAGSKIETTSMSFEAHANVSATVRGLASAKLEALGSVTVEGKAKFTVSTMGSGAIDAKGKLTVKAGGKLDLLAGGVMIIKAGGPASIKASTVSVIGNGRVSVKAPNVQLIGKATITKDAEIKGNLKCKTQATFVGKMKGKGGGDIKGMCKFG
jgi:phage gp45-like